MNVRELKAAIADLDDNLEIVVEGYDHGYMRVIAVEQVPAELHRPHWLSEPGAGGQPIDVLLVR